MSLLRCTLYVPLSMLMFGIPQWAAAAAPPDPDALARCAAIASPDARLACYDALTRGTQHPLPAAPAAPPTPASASGTASLPAAAPAPSSASASPASPPGSVPAPASSTANDPRNFGLTELQLHRDKAPVGPAAIQARIAKIVNTRYGRNYVVLDNGQTWAYTDSDEDPRLGPGDEVTIKRASLGSFMMNTPSKRSYHVRRTE